MPTGFKDSNGIDIGDVLVPKSYLIDRYPELADNFRFAGLWTWGYNNIGQLATGTTTFASSPVQTIASGANWKTIDAGASVVAGIKSDGTLWLWGSNGYGQLGDNTTVSKSSPVQTIATGTNWKSVSCGANHVMAIKTDGTLWGWGSNSNVYQLGTGNVNNYSSPVQIAGGGTNWKQVSCGQNHSGAIKTDGTLWMWGQGGNFAYYEGKLGTGDLNNRSTPVQTIAAGTNWKLVSCGAYSTTAIKTDGTLWVWGKNDQGELGTGNTTPYSSPVQTIAGGTNWKQVSISRSGGTGYTQVMSAIKTDGTLWLCGYNYYGQLGGSYGYSVSSPVQTVSGGTNWKKVVSSVTAVAAIKTDGSLWLWGNDAYGQLGQGFTSSGLNSPVQTISAGHNWIDVAIVQNRSESFIAIRDNSDDLI